MSVNRGRLAPPSYDGAAGGGEQTFGLSQNVPHARGCYQSEDGNGGSFTAFGGSWLLTGSRCSWAYHLQTHPPAAAFRDCVCDALQRCIGLRHCCCSSLRMRGRRPPRPRVLSSIDIGPSSGLRAPQLNFHGSGQPGDNNIWMNAKDQPLAAPAADPLLHLKMPIKIVEGNW